MADIKISELDPAAQANDTDLLEASQVQDPGYVTKKVSLDQVATVMAASSQVQDAIDASIAAIVFPPATPVGPAGGALSGTYPNPSLVGGPLSNYAPLASPTFTGDPKAPTPATADNDTSIATTAYVKANIAALPAPPTTLPPSGAAGGALAGTYPNPTLVGGPLSNYAPLASPALTGIPTAPTAAPATNTTQLATTAFVAAALASGASISVGLTPPASPAANQLWFYNDGTPGGGQIFIYYNDGNTSQWVPASPGTGTGGVLQTVSFETGAVATGTTTIPYDDTIPQITEGNEYMTLAITPRSATSRLVIDVVVNCANSVLMPFAVALFQDATANALAVGACALVNTAIPAQLVVRHVMTSGTTSATTFRVRAGGRDAGTTTFNGVGGARFYGGVLASSIVIQEVL